MSTSLWTQPDVAKELGFGLGVALTSVLALALPSWVTLSKSSTHSEPQNLPLYGGRKQTTHLKGGFVDSIPEGQAMAGQRLVHGGSSVGAPSPWDWP